MSRVLVKRANQIFRNYWKLMYISILYKSTFVCKLRSVLGSLLKAFVFLKCLHHSNFNFVACVTLKNSNQTIKSMIQSMHASAGSLSLVLFRPPDCEQFSKGWGQSGNQDRTQASEWMVKLNGFYDSNVNPVPSRVRESVAFDVKCWQIIHQVPSELARQ